MNRDRGVPASIGNFLRRFFFLFFSLVILPSHRGPPVLPTGVPPLIPRAASISMSLALAALSRAYETITSLPLRDLLRRMMSNVSGTYSYLHARPTCTPLRVTSQGFHWSVPSVPFIMFLMHARVCGPREICLFLFALQAVGRTRKIASRTLVDLIDLSLVLFMIFTFNPVNRAVGRIRDWKWHTYLSDVGYGNDLPDFSRYIEYFSGLLSGSLRISQSPLYLTHLTVLGVPLFEPTGCRAFLKVYEGLTPVYTSDLYSVTNAREFTVNLGGLRLRGDILVKCYHRVYSKQTREVMFSLQVRRQRTQ